MSLRPRWIGRAARDAATVLFALPLVTAGLTAQQVGRVVGRVIDAASGQGIVGAQVQIVGTAVGGLAGIDGRFAIPNVPAGAVTIQARRIGYTPKTVTGLQLGAGQTLEQSISLGAATVRLDVVTVEASAERGTVGEALDRQRRATGVVNAITSQQIAQSPDADAAQAVQRVSGVSVQDGKYVFVRGLGERYTTASLNGARLPSPEPERKVVPLDLFPAGLLQTITTSKTFTPDQSGDFSGAQVDVQTREFPARRVASYSASIGVNDAATGQTILAAPTVGQEWFGLGGSERALPGSIRAQGNFVGSYTQRDLNGFARTLRNVWTPETSSGLPNASLGASVGGEGPVLGQPIGYVGSLTYAAGQEVRKNEETALARGSADGVTEPFNEFRGSTGRTSVLWGGLANFSTLVGGRNRIALNNMYNRTADNEARQDEGFLENESIDAIRTTLRFTERTVRSNQLLGEHALGDRSSFDWSVTQSGVTRKEPDRADLVYVRPQNTGQAGALGTPQLYSASNEAARRTYGNLEEQAWDLAGSYRFSVGALSSANHLKVGAAYRDVRRDASNVAYSLFTPVNIPPRDILERRAEDIFGGGAIADTAAYFRIQPFAGGGSYAAEDRVAAGFLMGDYGLTSRIRVIAGARVENWRLSLRTEPLDASGLIATNRNTTDVLPSIAANVRVTDNQSLRLSASQTLARPEYRELSPILYINVLGGERGFGNPELRRTLIQNADVRYEWYPRAGEVFSLGAFAKRFEAPIERVTVATSGTQQFTFINAEGATNYGVEAEARKGLGGFYSPLEPLTAFANVTVMQSDITPGSGSFATLTNSSRPMVGQAPYVVNVGGTYASESGATTATVLYNVVGKRIFSAGVSPLPDAYEMPRNVLDVAVRFPVYRSLSAKLDAKNVLDAPYRLEQGSVTRERYTVGRSYTLGFSWR